MTREFFVTGCTAVFKFSVRDPNPCHQYVRHIPGYWRGASSCPRMCGCGRTSISGSCPGTSQWPGGSASWGWTSRTTSSIGQDMVRAAVVATKNFGLTMQQFQPYDPGLTITVEWEHWRTRVVTIHDDVIRWKHFPRYWPFVRGIHRSPVNSPHKGQWRGAFMFSLICARINRWVNNREAGDLRRYRAHYNVIVMTST